MSALSRSRSIRWRSAPRIVRSSCWRTGRPVRRHSITGHFRAPSICRNDSATLPIRVSTPAIRMFGWIPDLFRSAFRPRTNGLGLPASIRFLLSNNAPGFPHLFLGTGDPVNIWVGQLQARVFWGRLDQSAYSPVSGSAHFYTRGSDWNGPSRSLTRRRFSAARDSGTGIRRRAFFSCAVHRRRAERGFLEEATGGVFTKNEVAQGDSAGAGNQLASIFFAGYSRTAASRSSASEGTKINSTIFANSSRTWTTTANTCLVFRRYWLPAPTGSTC